MGQENYDKVDEAQGPMTHICSRTQTKTKGIARPGAKLLTLPLVDRHYLAYSSSEENLVTLASSHWTISAVPRSTASIYSQDSFAPSPPSPLFFSEMRVDRRRFAIALTPSQESPWSRQWRVSKMQSAAFEVFPRSIAADIVVENPSSSDDGEDEEESGGDGDCLDVVDVVRPDAEIVVAAEKIVQAAGLNPTKDIEADVAVGENTSQPLAAAAVGENNPGLSNEPVTTRPSLKNHSRKFPTSSSSKIIIGKMFSRLGSHSTAQQQPTCSNDEKQSILPETPPQIPIIHLPSPGLKLSGPFEVEQVTVTENDLRSFVLEKALPPRTRATLPSKWKPARPPSPLPAVSRKNGKHKRNAISLPYINTANNASGGVGGVAAMNSTPLPPLPSITHLALRVRHHSKPKPKSPPTVRGSYQSHRSSSTLTPVHSGSDMTSPDSDRDTRWAEVRRRLKARASKSATYAIHNGGIISPARF